MPVRRGNAQVMTGIIVVKSSLAGETRNIAVSRQCRDATSTVNNDSMRHREYPPTYPRSCVGPWDEMTAQ